MHYEYKTKGTCSQMIFFDVEDGKVKNVVLGCTHYPFVRKQIQEVLGDSVTIYDGAFGTAKELKRRIAEADLERADKTHKGSVRFENSNPTPEKIELCRQLLNYKE